MSCQIEVLVFFGLESAISSPASSQDDKGNRLASERVSTRGTGPDHDFNGVPDECDPQPPSSLFVAVMGEVARAATFQIGPGVSYRLDYNPARIRVYPAGAGAHDAGRYVHEKKREDVCGPEQ